jgi:hypothetical protein
MTAAAVNMTSCQGGSPLSQTRLLPPLRADGVQQGGRRAGRRCCHLIACPAATTPGPWRLTPPLPTPAGRLPDEVTRQRRWAGARCGPPRLPRAALGLPGPVRSALHSARRVARAHLLAGAPQAWGARYTAPRIPQAGGSPMRGAGAARLQPGWAAPRPCPPARHASRCIRHRCRAQAVPGRLDNVPGGPVRLGLPQPGAGLPVPRPLTGARAA